ncbi:hypothetical protein SAMN02745124_03867 [Desulfofustis glycolicus DSM 9705]|uniref:Uncharacterized protein n=1 Tax=Desulfofustis glycolicus DSM 9705 TaxID=1121409 RepID=A0A1M5YCI8_9BACT|nr:hypothetical protein SAMN02745124_03867 [Desulfofustis glycolicus DSM 9705]
MGAPVGTIVRFCPIGDCRPLVKNVHDFLNWRIERAKVTAPLVTPVLADDERGTI